MNKHTIFLTIIFFIAIFLRFYKLSELMPFIGDQGWFYISARDLILFHDIPLVGITASYTWLHQGALWTYMLAPAIWLFGFNPISGGILSICLGLICVIYSFFVGKKILNKEMGFLSALFFATSPLIVLNSRMPYHTSPIPLLVLGFIHAVIKYTEGKEKYLILASFLLGMLYSFELSTMVFWPILVIVFLSIRKINYKLLLESLIAFIIPLIPMLIYDFETGKFYQITAFLRILKLSLLQKSGISSKPLSNVFNDLIHSSGVTLFTGSEIISALLIAGMLLYVLKIIYADYKKRKINYSEIIIFLSVFLPLFGIISTRTVSGAYLPMLLPGVILIISFGFTRFAYKYKFYKRGIYLVFIAFCIGNIYCLLFHEYTSKNQIAYSHRVSIARQIVNSSGGQKYKLIGRGEGSQFESFTNNYEYLTWWLGNGPSKGNAKVTYTIEESDGKILLNKWQKK